MSWPVLPLGPSFLLTIVLGLLASPFAWLVVRNLKLARRVERRLWALFAVGAIAMLIGFGAWKSGVFPWAAWGVALVWTALPLLAAVVASLPLVLLLQIAPLLARKMRPRIRPASSGPVFSRRVALGIPLIAGGVAGSGFVAGSKLAKLRIFSIAPDRLHRDLAGLRILQLSDLHLGTGLDMRDLRALVAHVAPSRPDLVLLTGDVADTPAALKSGLPILERLAPRYGSFAVLGNHEYLSQRVLEMCAIYEASPIRLLVNESVFLSIGRARLGLIGVDDPLGTPDSELARTIVELGAKAQSSDYRILLSHRPSGFSAAARAGIELTLSGHTHGGQAGLLGKSWAEWAGLANWMWGFYRSEKSVLYTTAGAGDWFPFRFNCPREAPLFVLGGWNPTSGPV